MPIGNSIFFSMSDSTFQNIQIKRFALLIRMFFTLFSVEYCTKKNRSVKTYLMCRKLGFFDLETVSIVQTIPTLFTQPNLLPWDAMAWLNSRYDLVSISSGFLKRDKALNLITRHRSCYRKE